MHREQNLSATSGTSTDEEETLERPHWCCSSFLDSNHSEVSCWRGEMANNGKAMPSTKAHRANRSCSNTRASHRAGKGRSQTHSRTRFTTPRHRPAFYTHHYRKHAEFTKTPSASFNVYTAGIKEISQALSEGELTSVTILATYLRQIDCHNDTLRAIVHLAPRDQLYRLARQRDIELGLGRCRGPLHGIPILVK